MTANTTEQERAEFEAAYFAEKKRLLPGSSDDHLWKWFLGRSGDDYGASEANAAWWAWQAARRAPAVSAAWKDHDTAKLVNDLRSCALQYCNAEQLRERIAHLIRPLAEQLARAAVPVPQGWLEDVRGFLTAAADGSMSRNNQEQLAAELLHRLTAAPQQPEE